MSPSTTIKKANGVSSLGSQAQITMASPDMDSRTKSFEMKPSLAKQEWDRLKELDNTLTNEHMDKLMELVGLEEVKQQFLSLWAKVQVYKKQKVPHDKERYHIVLLGNPGTGKTSVAKIYCDFLGSLKVLKIDTDDRVNFLVVSGAKLAIMGAQEAESQVQSIAEVGGVVFIDETYQLSSSHNSSAGGIILDIVLTKMEENLGKLAVAFAGYNKDMQSFFEHNQGLRSRIPYKFQFEDFSDAELLSILVGNIKTKYKEDNGVPKMGVEGGLDGLFMRIAIRRLAAGRGLRGFGNARAVENLLAQISERQARRLSKEKREKQDKVQVKQDRHKLREERRQLKQKRRNHREAVRRLREEDKRLRDEEERLRELAAKLKPKTDGEPGTPASDGMTNGDITNNTAVNGLHNGHSFHDDLLEEGRVSIDNTGEITHDANGVADEIESSGDDMSAAENESDTDLFTPINDVDLNHDEYFHFTQEDLIGPPPSTALESPAFFELNRLIGLEAVKTAVENMIGMLETNYERELKELSPLNLSLNQVFFGAPGTGKTTVAKLYGQIMSRLALLSDGEVVVKNPSDFIGNAVGVSESNTRNILAATKGKVLVIDEAYMLNSGIHGQGSSYGASVIDTIVAEVQGVPGEDRCIILVGYEDLLKDMFQHANPGLARRFRMDRGFRFDNFTTDQLIEILEKKMEDEDLKASDEAKEVARKMFERAQARASFSNAGEVVTLLDIAKMNFQARIQKETSPRFDDELRPEDFDPECGRAADAAANCKAALQGKVSDSILDKMLYWIRKAEVATVSKVPLPELVPTKFIIRGPAGTGKKTAARKVGKIFYDMGFLGTKETVEKSVSDLMGQYVGHTAPKTKAVLESCLGKALFVRDAARLAERSSYASETVSEIESLLNSPKYRDKVVVVFAGTAEEMDNLLATRPALSRLFREQITSQPLTPDESLALLQQTLESKGIAVPFLDNTIGESYEKAKERITTLAKSPWWENANTVQELAQKLAEPLLESWQDQLLRTKVAPPKGPLKKGSRGTFSAEQVTDALRKTVDDHVKQFKESRNARRRKKAADVADLLGDGASGGRPPEASQNASPPSFRELATWALAPLLTGGGSQQQKTPQPQPKSPTMKELRSFKQQKLPLRRRSSHSLDPTSASAASDPLKPTPRTPEPEKGVSAEEFRRVQELYEQKKKESVVLSLSEKQKEELEKKEIMKQVKDKGVCVYGYEWFKANEGMWQCTGGLHEMRCVGGIWQARERY